jgi:hypothetical protein
MGQGDHLPGGQGALTLFAGSALDFKTVPDDFRP